MVTRARFSAGGKAILLGEHFVVHGVPAIALPLPGIRTTVIVRESTTPSVCLSTSLEGRHRALAERVLSSALELLEVPAATAWEVRVDSELPVGYGLGSSAAYSAALLGALASACGRSLAGDEHNRLAHELERLVHGQPSGIDDTVVTRGQAVLFERGQPPRFVAPGCPMSLVLGGCGYPGSTRDAVESVRRWGIERPERFAAILVEARALVLRGLAAFEAGDAEALGTELSANHSLLTEIGVSTDELDTLVVAARGGGALGAKLTGAGWGGFALALVRSGDESSVARAMSDAGASPVLHTTLAAS